MFNYLHERLDSLESKIGHRRRLQNNGFMSCILKVDTHQSGWHKAVLSILKSRQINHFEMDEGGFFRLYGIADLNGLLRTLEKKGRRVKIKSLWHGQCSENVYLASYEAAAPPPPVTYPYHHRPVRYPYHPRPRLSDQELEDDVTWPLIGEGITCCSVM